MIFNIGGDGGGGVAPNLQTKSKTYTPSLSQQTDNITADAGYDGLQEVDVTIDAMPAGSVTAPASISGANATVNYNTTFGTLELSKSINVTPDVTTPGYITTGTAGASSVKLTAAVNGKDAETYYPALTDRAINANTWLYGVQSIKKVTTTNIAAGNIKAGVTVEVGDADDPDRLISVTGNYHGTLQSKSKTYTPATTQITDTISPDALYDGMSSVDITVDAMPAGSVTAPASITGANATITYNSALSRLQLSGTANVTPDVTTPGYITTGTTGTPTVTLSAPANKVDATTYYPSTTDQTIPANRWLTGAQTFKAVTTTNLTAGNIVNGVTVEVGDADDPDRVASVTGSYVPASGSVTAPATITGTSATLSYSVPLSRLTLSQTVSVTPNVTQAGYISSGTAGNSTVTLYTNTGYQEATTWYPSTSNQTLSANKWLTGAQTFKAVTTTNLTAANIKDGVTVEVGDADDPDRIISVLGTYTGGSSPTLITTKNLGTISTSSTSAVDTGQTVSVTGLTFYDLLIVLASVKTKTNNRHIGTAQVIFLGSTSSYPTKNAGTIATATWNAKLSSTGVVSTRTNTTKYGIYANTVSLSSGINPTATLAIYERYNSTQTGTINGEYEVRVYGVKLYDLIGA